MMLGRDKCEAGVPHNEAGCCVCSCHGAGHLAADIAKEAIVQLLQREELLACEFVSCSCRQLSTRTVCFMH